MATSLDALQHAAETERSAKTALALQLLSRSPQDASRGVKLLQAAAEEGCGEAAHLLAILAGSGLRLPQNWRAALDHLQRAAECGYPFAQQELALLAGDPVIDAAISSGAPIPPAGWAEVRRKTDIRPWLLPAQFRLASSTPRIAIAERFIAPEICDWLITRSRPLLQPASIDDPATGKARYGGTRTNSAAVFELAETGLILHLLRARISALAGLPPSAMEGSTVLHYTVGQQFFPHYDFLDTANPGYAAQVRQFGQRVLTFLIYLNDDFEGGETEFPMLDWRYKGRKGDALFFRNALPNTQPDRKTLHAGLPPTEGEKWLFSQWVRGQPV
jgi:hypothetical protein